jgi:D-lactate dehydrogenase
MKIAFFETKPEEKEFFQKYIKNAKFFEKPVNEYSNLEEFDIISIFINSKIDKNILDKLKNVKYIQTRSSGYDHIDIVECYKRGIIVSNVKGYAGAAVGEFAFSLLLEALRKTFIAITRVKNSNLYYKDLKGVEIANKTIGVLGLGSIGGNIVKISKGFGANVIGFSRSYKEEFKDIYTNSLEEVLTKSDFLFIALPLTPKTKNLINKKNISLFKGNVIINPARAEIIEEDVYKNFNGIIAADVLPNWELAKKENIIATPHMAYYTKEALKRIMEISLQNLQDFLNNKKPRHCLKIECQKNYPNCK